MVDANVVIMLPPLKKLQKSSQTKNKPLRQAQIVFDNGRFHIPGLDTWYSYWDDPYHLLLTIPWLGFFLLIAIFYFLVNTIFALLYLVGGNCIANAQPGSFLDAFFFSVQTIASIGYGAMYPTTTYANILVTIEALISIISIALITGIAFARFAKPTARVLFSNVAVITDYDGLPTLMFRAANQRHNQILEAKLRLYLLQDEISREGQFMRRLHNLPLLRSHTPSFSLSWTAMHPIDEQSPLYQATSSSLSNDKAMIIASLTGIDETVAQAIHARHTYGTNDILWNHQFVDVIYHTAAGHRYLDLAHFHKVQPSSNDDST